MDNSRYLLEELPFDTEILARNTAKLVIVSKPEDVSQKNKLVKAIIEDCKKRELEYVTTRIKADDFPTIHALESQGFKLVDGYMVLEASVENGEFYENIREATEDDIPRLQEIAGSSFSKTRFYNDPEIKKSQADEIYSQWIKNCVFKKAADLVLVWMENDTIVGFTTMKKNGNIVLIAVENSKQGKGIGKNLVKAALKKFYEWGIKSSTIETQMTNISALRTYMSCGYKITESHLTFRWSLYGN